MSYHETLYLSPSDTIELFEQLRHLFDNTEASMEFESYIKIVNRLTDLKDRIHYCKGCAKRYFRDFLQDDTPEYKRQCYACKKKEEESE